jgi:hypothetical protein
METANSQPVTSAETAFYAARRFVPKWRAGVDDDEHYAYAIAL